MFPFVYVDGHEHNYSATSVMIPWCEVLDNGMSSPIGMAYHIRALELAVRLEYKLDRDPDTF